MTARRPKVATNSLKTWAGPLRACVEAVSNGKAEHDVGCGDADDCACALNHDVERSFLPWKAAHEGVREGDYGIEVRAGDGFEREDDGDQRGAGCE